MTEAIMGCCILAQYSKWTRLGDGFRRTGPPLEFADIIPYLVGFLVFSGIVSATIAYRRRNDLKRPCSDSQKLFRELCLAHGLDSAAQKLLSQLADAFQLDQPAEVFVTPRVFSSEQLPNSLRAESGRIRDLQQRLF